jgi:hypothetical protein
MAIGIRDLGESAWKLNIPINVVTARAFHLPIVGRMQSGVQANPIAHGFGHCGGSSGRIARHNNTSNDNMRKRSL